MKVLKTNCAAAAALPYVILYLLHQLLTSFPTLHLCYVTVQRYTGRALKCITSRVTGRPRMAGVLPRDRAGSSCVNASS
jgi:hypothetical protein